MVPISIISWKSHKNWTQLIYVSPPSVGTINSIALHGIGVHSHTCAHITQPSAQPLTAKKTNCNTMRKATITLLVIVLFAAVVRCEDEDLEEVYGKLQVYPPESDHMSGAVWLVPLLEVWCFNREICIFQMTPERDLRRRTSRREPGVTTWRGRIPNSWECRAVEKTPRIDEPERFMFLA